MSLLRRLAAGVLREVLRLVGELRPCFFTEEELRFTVDFCETREVAGAARLPKIRDLPGDFVIDLEERSCLTGDFDAFWVFLDGVALLWGRLGVTFPTDSFVFFFGALVGSCAFFACLALGPWDFFSGLCLVVGAAVLGLERPRLVDLE